MSNEKREQQMMDAADRYAEEMSKNHPVEEWIAAINDFCAGWRTADFHPNWIPVERELPKEDGRYWCCDDNCGQEELRWKGGRWYGLLDPYPIKGITYWMPLPQPPQGKEE